jgi:signal transduction histidine kinase
MKRTVETLMILVLGVCFNLKANAYANNVDSLLQCLEVVSENEKPELLNKISTSLLQSDLDKSLEFARQSLLLSVSNRDRLNEGRAHLNIGKIMLERGADESVLTTLEQSFIIGKELNSKTLITESLKAIAEYHYHFGNIDDAYSNYSEVLNYLSLPDDEKDIAIVNTKKGEFLSEQGNYAKALDIFLSALNVFEKQGDKINIAMVKCNIASNFKDLDNYSEALDYYEQALTIYREQNNLASQAEPLYSIGEIYNEQEEFDKAAVYYRQCYGLGIMIANSKIEGIGMLGLGESFLQSGKVEEAIKKTDAAGAIFKEIGYLKGVAGYHYSLGEIELSRGNLLNAADNYWKSIGLAEKLKIYGLVKKNLDKLSFVAEKNGEYESAFNLYKKYSEVKDSVFNNHKVEIIAEVQSRYELNEMKGELDNLARNYSIKDKALSKKQFWIMFFIIVSVLLSLSAAVFVYLYFSLHKINKSLKYSTGIISAQKSKLENLNATKDKLLSIIGHDLRGSVGATKSMLYQLVKDPDLFPPEEQSVIREELYHLSEDTYELLENLLSWAKSQREFKIYKDSNSIKKLVEYNAEQLRYFAAKKNISLTSHFPEEYLVNCDRNMINLVIRNIISNAIKFTPENGVISLFGEKKDKFFKLSVKDSGVGIPPENITRIFDSGDFFTTYGTNSEKGSGLGLLLCREFVEKNGGTLSIESTPGNGTVISFTIEILEETNKITVDKVPAPPIVKPVNNN